MRAIPTPLRSFLPLAGLLVLAATNACVIINDDGDDDDDQCVDLTEVCPNLVCESGNVVVDGCAICECNTACDPGPAPECAFPVLVEEECRWECGTSGCFVDDDCGPGFVCVRPGTGTNDGDQADPAEGTDAFPAPDGVCIPVETGCFSDADCGAGFFCDFANGGNDAAPPPPDDGGAEPQPDPIPPPPEGQCAPLPTTACASDADCAEGEVCEFPDFANGLVAPGGVCVTPTPVSECEFDTDCAEGQVCAVECQSDPNCPACDVCFFVGTCVTPEQPCSSDDQCVAGEFCDFGAAPAPCLDADGDGLCDNAGDRIAPPQGVCRPFEEPNPCAAVLCVEGTTCVVENGEAKCIATEPLCAGDEECREGLVCNAAELCLPPPDCAPSADRPCIDLCYGFCVAPVVSCFSDADCGRGEVCVFDGAVDAGGANRPIIAPQGTCQPAPTPCDADVVCAEGEICLNGQCTIDPNANPCATVRCSAGTTCQVDAAGNAECVPDAAVCSSDADCANGGRCNAGVDVCNPPPDCRPGEACADVCFGFCE